MKTTKDLIKFDFDVAVISALDAKYKDIQITDRKSYDVVMAGLAEYRELRLAIDDKHKELKKDILDAGRGLDGDKNRLKALLEPGENHLKEIRQVEDDRKTAIKAEKDRKERKRIEVIQGKIDNIRHLGIMLPNVSALVIEERLIIVKAMKLPEDVEFTGQAETAQKTAIVNLEQALTERLDFEKEEVERKAEAERLEELRKKLQVVQKKVDEENRKIEKEKTKLEADKIEEGNRKRMEDFERQATIQAEADAVENTRQKAEEAEALEAVKAEEKARQESLRPDKEKLMAYADALTAITLPKLEAKEANTIVVDAISEIGHIVKMIKERAEEL